MTELESAPCPMGCPEDDELLFVGRDTLHGMHGEFPVVRCRRCHLVRTNPRPSPQSIHLYYPEDYGPHASVRSVPAGPRRRSLLRRLARSLIDFRADNLPELRPGSMVEVGCASGAFLSHMQARGWRVRGVELSESASRKARTLGHWVENCALEDAPDWQGEFDLVVARMVVEHLHHPIAGLERLHRWTRPGGMLVMTVPAFGGFAYRMFGALEFSLDVPRHLFHFTPRTVTAALGRAGWEVDQIWFHRHLGNFAKSLRTWLKRRGISGRLTHWVGQLTETEAGLVATYPAALAAAALGETGRMTIWARRVET